MPHSTSRREFVKTAGAAALAASLFPDDLWAQRPARRRYAIVGTGDRGSGMWGRDLVQRYPGALEVVGLCDINPKRTIAARNYIGVSCPTFTSIDEMLDTAKPDLLMVTTVDGFHHEYIIKGLVRSYERQPWTAPATHEIYLTKSFGRRTAVPVPKLLAGHGGGDDRLRDLIFKKTDMPDYMRLPDSRAGAMSCLTGIAIRNSIDEKKPVRIADLVKL